LSSADYVATFYLEAPLTVIEMLQLFC